MIYIFEGYENSASIVYDEAILTQAEKERGIVIEHLPAKEEIEGKVAVLKCSKDTSEVWWEYVDEVKDVELEELQQTVQAQQTQIDELTLQLGDALLGGAL